jgi:hypothetical protein
LRSNYADVAAKVRAFAQNRVGLMPSQTAVSEVTVAGGQSDGYEIWDLDAVEMRGGQCWTCNGWGHISRFCPNAKGKGKGKGQKGKTISATFPQSFSPKGFGKGASPKGKGARTCWTCGSPGHLSAQCDQRPVSEVEVEEAVDDVGGVWLVAAVEDVSSYSDAISGDVSTCKDVSTYSAAISYHAPVSTRNRFGVLAFDDPDEFPTPVESFEVRLPRRHRVRWSKPAETICAVDDCNDATNVCTIKFIVADVSKPLVSAQKVVAAGNHIMWRKDGGFIQND